LSLRLFITTATNPDSKKFSHRFFQKAVLYPLVILWCRRYALT
jgi:hypothetical protein